MLGAVVLKAHDVSDARLAVALLRKPAETKIHWHGQSERGRDQGIRTIVKLPIEQGGSTTARPLAQFCETAGSKSGQ